MVRYRPVSTDQATPPATLRDHDIPFSNRLPYDHKLGPDAYAPDPAMCRDHGNLAVPATNSP